jgi:hypothetical protein
MKRGSITGATVLLAFALAGCGGGVQVRPSGLNQKLQPKPKNCDLEFLYQAPARAFEAIAELNTHVTNAPPGGAIEALRPKACELGADALIVTQNFVTNELGHALVAGTAIKYGSAPAPAERKSDSSAADL